MIACVILVIDIWKGVVINSERKKSDKISFRPICEGHRKN